MGVARAPLVRVYFAHGGNPRSAKASTLSESVVGARWVLTWKMVGGKKDVKAHLVAKGNQDPDLKEGLLETSGMRQSLSLST